MTKVQVRSEVSLEELIHGVEQLNTADLEQFVSKVLTVQAQRRAPNLNQQESELLRIVNQGLEEQEEEEFAELSAKSEREELTPPERQRLIALAEQIEQQDAERIRALGELAKLRNTSLQSLIQELDIRRRIDK